MKFYLKLSLRELWGNRRVSAAILFNLVLGLTGLLTISLFKSSVEHSVAVNSKEYLGADLSVSSRRPLSAEEMKSVQEILPAGSRLNHARELYTTVGTGTDARLVQLRAYEPGYPFYGQMKKESGYEGPEEVFAGRGVWIYPELREQLDLEVGEVLRLGEIQAEILGVVASDKASASTNMALAPSLYIGAETLDRTGLIQKGSLVRHAYLAKLPESADLDSIKRRLELALTEHDLRVSTHLESSERSHSAILYLSDYLSLVSLVGLFLSILGTTYILRTHLQKRAPVMGLLRAMGISGGSVQALFFIQIGVLGVLAGALSLSISYGLATALITVLRDLLGDQFTLNFEATRLLLLILMIFLITFLMALPYSDRLRTLKVSNLFRESWESPFEFSIRSVLLWAPAVIGLVVLTFVLTKSPLLSSVFLITLVGAFFALIFSGWLLFSFFGRRWKRDWAWNQGLKFLDRERYSSLTAFAALSLGLALVTMTFQLERGLVREIALPGAETRPGFFLFDLQDEQFEDFEIFLNGQGIAPLHVAPMIRARLKSVNGEVFEKNTGQESFETREGDRERSLRNRGFNLSYQGELQSSQKIVAGQWNESVFNPDMPAISVEKRFADRLGFNLSDVLVFDVQGVEVQGKIVSFRRVHWGSFQPNFFVTFQPGVLEPAPKTFVVTLPEISQKAQFQADLAAEFPNVSSVDVRRTLDRLLELVKSMAQSFRLMAFLTLFAGLGVFLSILQFRLFHRTRDLLLLRTVGASSKNLRWLVFVETTWMAVGSSLFGLLVGVVLSILPSKMLFDGIGAPPPWFLAALPAALVVVSYTLATVWTRRVLSRARGLEQLR